MKENYIKIKESIQIKCNEGKLILDENEYIQVLTEDKWSGEVKTKWEPKEGLFANGSAEEIASSAKSGHGGNVGKAIQAVNFYLQRAGKNLDSEAKGRIEHAKEILQKELESKKESY